MYSHICTQGSIHGYLFRRKQQKVFVSDDDFSTQLVLDSRDGKFRIINNNQQWQHDYNCTPPTCVNEAILHEYGNKCSSRFSYITGVRGC